MHGPLEVRRCDTNTFEEDAFEAYSEFDEPLEASDSALAAKAGRGSPAAVMRARRLLQHRRPGRRGPNVQGDHQASYLTFRPHLPDHCWTGGRGPKAVGHPVYPGGCWYTTMLEPASTEPAVLSRSGCQASGGDRSAEAGSEYPLDTALSKTGVMGLQGGRRHHGARDPQCSSPLERKSCQ